MRAQAPTDDFVIELAAFETDPTQTRCHCALFERPVAFGTEPLALHSGASRARFNIRGVRRHFGTVEPANGTPLKWLIAGEPTGKHRESLWAIGVQSLSQECGKI